MFDYTPHNPPTVRIPAGKEAVLELTEEKLQAGWEEEGKDLADWLWRNVPARMWVQMIGHSLDLANKTPSSFVFVGKDEKAILERINYEKETN